VAETLVSTVEYIGNPGEVLARAEVLYFPGGEPRAVLKIRGTDLVRIPGMLVADLIQPPRSARTRGPASAAAR